MKLILIFTATINFGTQQTRTTVPPSSQFQVDLFSETNIKMLADEGVPRFLLDTFSRLVHVGMGVFINEKGAVFPFFYVFGLPGRSLQANVSAVFELAASEVSAENRQDDSFAYFRLELAKNLGASPFDWLRAKTDLFFESTVGNDNAAALSAKETARQFITLLKNAALVVAVPTYLPTLTPVPLKLRTVWGLNFRSDAPGLFGLGEKLFALETEAKLVEKKVVAKSLVANNQLRSLLHKLESHKTSRVARVRVGRVVLVLLVALAVMLSGFVFFIVRKLFK